MIEWRLPFLQRKIITISNATTLIFGQVSNAHDLTTWSTVYLFTIRGRQKKVEGTRMMISM